MAGSLAAGVLIALCSYFIAEFLFCCIIFRDDEDFARGHAVLASWMLDMIVVLILVGIALAQEDVQSMPPFITFCQMVEVWVVAIVITIGSGIFMAIQSENDWRHIAATILLGIFYGYFSACGLLRPVSTIIAEHISWVNWFVVRMHVSYVLIIAIGYVDERSILRRYL